MLQAAWLRLKAILARTIRRAAGSLLALLGAGGVVLLLAMVIGAAAAVIGSPMGILFADESGDPNSIRIAEIVAETNADFGTAINDIVSAHPECSETTMDSDSNLQHDFRAIPHNSKCRYGERGVADAVPQPPYRCLNRQTEIMRRCPTRNKKAEATRRFVFYCLALYSSPQFHMASKIGFKL